MMSPNCISLSKSKVAVGIVSIEFVLMMAGVFIPIVLGTFEIGRVFYQYNAITKSVRDGARFISFYSTTNPNYAAYQTQATNLVLYGNTAGTGNLLIPNLTAGMISINTTAVAAAGSIKLVTLSVTGYNLGYITSHLSGNKAFNVISASMRQATT